MAAGSSRRVRRRGTRRRPLPGTKRGTLRWGCISRGAATAYRRRGMTSRLDEVRSPSPSVGLRISTVTSGSPSGPGTYRSSTRTAPAGRQVDRLHPGNAVGEHRPRGPECFGTEGRDDFADHRWQRREFRVERGSGWRVGVAVACGAVRHRVLLRRDVTSVSTAARAAAYLHTAGACGRSPAMWRASGEARLRQAPGSRLLSGVAEQGARAGC
jgi:hypothetical protein